MKTNITEIIPDNMPEWMKEAMDEGQLFNKVISRCRSYEATEDFMVAVASMLGCLPSFADPSPAGDNNHIIQKLADHRSLAIQVAGGNFNQAEVIDLAKRLALHPNRDTG